jgi:N-acetyl-S-(2-succino)cysteine monooxygenase
MTKGNRQAILLLFCEWGGMHTGAWRASDSPTDPTTDFEVCKQMVQTAERGKFHGFFIADAMGFAHDMSPEALAGSVRSGARFEPMTLATALAMHTRQIGVLLTASTTYNAPFTVARQFASLDRLSGGRSGWNVVTSANPQEARNFGLERRVDHALRYERATEFFEVVSGLWDSFDDDAFPRDKHSGMFFDPDKLHVLDHRGEHFSVAGPLNVPRCPQGYPVIAQAGSSGPGREFASRFAELVYTLPNELGKARELYAELKARAADHGRGPDDVKIMPSLVLVVGKSEAEAQERLTEYDELVPAQTGLELLSALLEMDLSSYPLDGPVPEIPETELGAKTRQQFFLERARRQGLTVRQLAQQAARTGTIAGSPNTIADRIEEWLLNDAADGFNLGFADPVQSLTNFVELVVPELQRRGLFRTDYAGATLRENLGLPRPGSRWAARERTPETAGAR